MILSFVYDRPFLITYAYLVAVQLPYNRLVGNPGLLPTGTMSGLSFDTKAPAAHVNPPEVSEVFSTFSAREVCRLGGVAKS